MTKLSPAQKQALSALAMGLAGALLTWANQHVHLLPGNWAVLGALVLNGLVHAVPTLGTADKIEAQANEKAVEKVAAIVDREGL